MKKFSFTIDMVSDNLDIETTQAEIQQFLAEKHDNIVSQVKSAGVKNFSEQGFKVWRARVTGVTAKQAGDAHNPKAEATTS
jgi:Na+-translocating ferredoxin:NAD+ oxidoreductase RnfC subunit